MILCIADVLGPADVAALAAALDAAAFEDGRATAGWHAAMVKANEQAAGAALEGWRARVEAAVAANLLFQLAARPRRLRPVMFNRYRAGMAYGAHVDDAVMGGDTRADVSFTLFLADPESYAGGELVLETTAGEQAFKLPAGALVLYPASTLHRVEPVAEGVRVAAVGWLQSLVRDPARRELLFDLDTARRALFEREGKTREFDLLSKSVSNLLRMWGET